jgi:hypothetical protein
VHGETVKFKRYYIKNISEYAIASCNITMLYVPSMGCPLYLYVYLYTEICDMISGFEELGHLVYDST